MFLFDTESKQDKRVQWELLNLRACVHACARECTCALYWHLHWTSWWTNGLRGVVFLCLFVFCFFTLFLLHLTATTLASSCVKGESVTARTLEKSATYLFICVDIRVVKQVSHLSGSRAEACLLGRLSNKKNISLHFHTSVNFFASLEVAALAVAGGHSQIILALSICALDSQLRNMQVRAKHRKPSSTLLDKIHTLKVCIFFVMHLYCNVCIYDWHKINL